ncbi:MAG: tetratricopeptide repeat protein [Clostridia bacterium]|nr:tetratricopeptide repeat protein [Clostridia bacterium]
MEGSIFQWLFGSVIVPILTSVVNAFSGDKAEKDCPLALPSPPPGVKLIGREADIKRFTRGFRVGRKITIISGIGGVGKTEFAKEFVEKKKRTLGRVGWFEYKSNFRDTLLGVPGLVREPKVPIEQRYDEILSHLRGLKRNDVLVFDNVSIGPDDGRDDIFKLPCRIIITTRDSFDEVKNLQDVSVARMDFLSELACADLFAYYREKSASTAEETDIKKIVSLAGRHTLALEFMATICREVNLSATDLLGKLKNEEFDLRGLSKEVEDSGGVTSEHLLKQMATLYRMADIEKLGDEAVWLLTNLCILPLKNFPVDVLLRWLELPGISLLNKLGDKRLIRFVEGKKTIEMHDVIAEVLRQELKPNSVSCERLIKAVTKEISYEQTDIRIYEAPYLYCAESIAKHMCEQTEMTAYICSIIGFVYFNKDDYENALHYNLRDLAISENVTGKDETEIATTYNNLAPLYRSKGDYENALHYGLSALEIRERKLGKFHSQTVDTYNNLATIYQGKGDYPNALRFYLDALEVSKSVDGKEKSRTATIHSNLATLYAEQGKHDNAWCHFSEAVSVTAKALGMDHPMTAFTYMNLAEYCQEHRSIDEARNYARKAHNTYLGIFGTDHPKTKDAAALLADLA